MDVDEGLAEKLCAALANYMLPPNIHESFALSATSTFQATPEAVTLLQDTISLTLAEEVRRTFPGTEEKTIEIITKTLRTKNVTDTIFKKTRINPDVLLLVCNRAQKGGGVAGVGERISSVYRPVLASTWTIITTYIHSRRPESSTINIAASTDGAVPSSSHSAVKRTHLECITFLVPIIQALSLPKDIDDELLYINSCSSLLEGTVWNAKVDSGQRCLGSVLGQDIILLYRASPPQFYSEFKKVLLAPRIMAAMEGLISKPVRSGSLAMLFNAGMRKDDRLSNRDLVRRIYEPLMEPLQLYMSHELTAQGPGKLKPENYGREDIQHVVADHWDFTSEPRKKDRPPPCGANAT